MKKCNAFSFSRKHLAEKKQQLWQEGNACILRSVMENLNCDSASIYTNTFSYTYSFIAFMGQHSHANVCTRILILSAKGLQTTTAPVTRFGIKRCFFSLHKAIFYYAILAFLLSSSHPSDCHLRGISKILLT